MTTSVPPRAFKLENLPSVVFAGSTTCGAFRCRSCSASGAILASCSGSDCNASVANKMPTTGVTSSKTRVKKRTLSVYHSPRCPANPSHQQHWTSPFGYVQVYLLLPGDTYISVHRCTWYAYLYVGRIWYELPHKFPPNPDFKSDQPPMEVRSVNLGG